MSNAALQILDLQDPFHTSLFTAPATFLPELVIIKA